MADFLANDAYRYAPLPSPPSPPVQWDDKLYLVSDDEEKHGSPWELASDPYSANAKATRSPLIHDTTRSKAYTMPLTPSSSSADYDSISTSPAPHAKITYRYVPIRQTAVQDPLWEEAINDVFSHGSSVINLDNSNITSIPRAISDLNNIVFFPNEPELDTRPASLSYLPETPTRSSIASVAAHSRRVLSQARSSNSLFSGSPIGRGSNKAKERELQIYLANNQLTVLPSELFALKGLVLLSLRANKLRELPHVIAEIKSLRSLNIAGNELAYLPAELTTLTLQTLLVDPNPFISPPSSLKRTSPSSIDRSLGSLKLHTRIPKLSELALRVALRRLPELPTLSFSPSATNTPGRPTALPTPSPSHVSIFTASMVSPAPERHWPSYNTHRFPPHPLLVSSYYNLTSWLSSLPDYAAAPMRAAMSGTNDAREVYSTCPSPRHHRFHPKDEEEGNGAFICPSEERLEWVASLAGCDLAGAAPILWRGCRAGCLDFLEAGDAIDMPYGNQTGGRKEQDDDEEFIGMFAKNTEDTMEEAKAVVQTQIIWDDMMELDG